MIARIDEIKSTADTVGGVIEVLAGGRRARRHRHLRRIGSPARRCLGLGGHGHPGHQRAWRSATGSWRPCAPDCRRMTRWVPGADGRITRLTNRAGGIEGGMSSGQPIRVRAAMKPIPSIPRALRTVDVTDGEAASAINQRSDTTAVPAASVVAEAMVRLHLGAIRP